MGSTLGGIPSLLACALLALGINWIAFVPAYLRRTERFYDLIGSSTYLIVVIAALSAGARSPLAWLLAAMVATWAIRLGSFLVARIRADGTDRRFDAIKQDPVRFLIAWTVQALWVTITAGAALAAISSSTSENIGVISVIGFALWLVGFGLEVAADAQKRAFRADSANAGRFISSGLWAWSRHPNYFGEITLWSGVAIIAAPTLHGWYLLTLVSPLFVLLLLTRASGIPLLEASGRKRWGAEPAYQRYLEQTPVLVPRRPRTA